MNRSDGLITKLGPKSIVAEAYRTLRTNLEFISPDNPLRTLLITSSGPGEGKSTTVANLAISMTQIGKKVLLIDCDLRKPVQHKIFEISNLEGLTNVLINPELPLEQVIQQTTVDNLFLLPCGSIPPNPAELLGSQRMVTIINQLLEKYDYIIFDAPPIISVTDAAVLATVMDGVLLVVAERQAERMMVKKAYELLIKVKAHVLGVIMNKVNFGRGYEYYYYYDSKGKSHGG